MGHSARSNMSYKLYVSDHFVGTALVARQCPVNDNLHPAIVRPAFGVAIVGNRPVFTNSPCLNQVTRVAT